jgi:hypothetical protein
MNPKESPVTLFVKDPCPGHDSHPNRLVGFPLGRLLESYDEEHLFVGTICVTTALCLTPS